LAEARGLAVRLLALEKQRALRQQQTELARKLSEFTQGRASKGELSPLDAAQAQVDAQRLLLEGRRIEVERVALLGALKPMLGIAPGDSLNLVGELPALVVPGIIPGSTGRTINWPGPRSRQRRRTPRWRTPSVCRM